MKTGIDVSKHQGEIDWKKVNANNVEFAIVRAGIGKLTSQKDPFFEKNYKGCKENNIPCGAYWYSYAKSEPEAKQEAVTCLAVIKGKQFEYPIYFDIEENSQFKLGKAKCTAIAKAFCETVEKAGYFVGIYSSKSGLENYIDESLRNRYTIWVAHVGVAKTTYQGAAMWQHSWKGRINGLNGDVDCNYCYTDFPSVIKSKGLNGFSTSQKKPEEKESASSQAGGKASTSKIAAGRKIQLDHIDLFVSSDAKRRAIVLTGFYYISDGRIINDRIRITSSPNAAVIGWIDVKRIKETG